MASSEQASCSSSPRGHDGLQDSEACVICCQTLGAGDATFQLPCGHRHWHESCVTRWLVKRHTCPVCRAHFPEFGQCGKEDCSDEDIASDEEGLTSADFEELHWILGTLRSYGTAPADSWLDALRDVRSNLERRASELDEEHHRLEEQVQRLETDLESQREQLCEQLCCLCSEDATPPLAASRTPRRGNSSATPRCLAPTPTANSDPHPLSSAQSHLAPISSSTGNLKDAASSCLGTCACRDLDAAVVSSAVPMLSSGDVTTPADGSAKPVQTLAALVLPPADISDRALVLPSPTTVDDSLAWTLPRNFHSEGCTGAADVLLPVSAVRSSNAVSISPAKLSLAACEELILRDGGEILNDAEMLNDAGTSKEVLDLPVEVPDVVLPSVDVATESMVARLRGAVLRAPAHPGLVFRKLAAPGHLITLPILAQLLRQFEAGMSDVEVARVFAYLDCAGTGKLDEMAWLTSLQLLPNQSGEFTSASESEQAQAWELLYRVAAALHRSGHSASSLFWSMGGGRPLSRAELESLLGAFAGTSEGAIANAVKLLDANGIGQVEAVEFERVLDPLVSTAQSSCQLT